MNRRRRSRGKRQKSGRSYIATDDAGGFLRIANPADGFFSVLPMARGCIFSRDLRERASDRGKKKKKSKKSDSFFFFVLVFRAMPTLRRTHTSILFVVFPSVIIIKTFWGGEKPQKERKRYVVISGQADNIVGPPIREVYEPLNGFLDFGTAVDIVTQKNDDVILVEQLLLLCKSEFLFDRLMRIAFCFLRFRRFRLAQIVVEDVGVEGFEFLELAMDVSYGDYLRARDEAATLADLFDESG